MKVGINFDSTKFIEESVHEIQIELVLAVLLTALVCWLFLGSFSSTLNVVLAIPMSLLGTVAVIYFLGFTLNTFTLLGLVARRRHRRRRRDHGAGEHLPPRRDGQGPGRARRARAREEITFAALAATLAVVAIFLPVVFMKGVVGKFFLQFGVTLCVAVLLSYLEAITLAPARCAQILDTSRERTRGRVGRFVDRGFERARRGYTRRALASRPEAAGAGARRPPSRSSWWRSSCCRACPSEFVPSQDQSRLIDPPADRGRLGPRRDRQLFRRAEAVMDTAPEVERALRGHRRIRRRRQ